MTLNKKSIDISKKNFKLDNFTIDSYAYANYVNEYLKENKKKKKNP